MRSTNRSTVRARSCHGCWLSAALAIAACGHPAAPTTPPVAPAPPPARSTPSPARVAAAGWQLDRSTFDPAAAPCTDFYQYVCGGFAASAQIPADRTSVDWQRDAAIAATDREIQALLTGTATTGDAANDAEVARLRTFFAACMATGDAADDVGLDTLAPWLARIAAIQDRRGLQPVLGELHAAGIHAMFRYQGAADRTNRARYRGQIDPGAFGARRIYLEHGADLAARRTAYRAHVREMLRRSGMPLASATSEAGAVLAIEGELVAAAPSAEAAFDPAQSEHPMPAPALAAIAPHFDWTAYFGLVGQPADQPVNVTSLGYLKIVDRLLATRSLADLRAYLRWTLLDSLGPALPSRLADEAYQFSAEPGTARPPRAETCQLETLKAMGVELSRQYALHAVGPAARDQAVADAAAIQAELAGAVAANAWLSPAARAASAHKVATLVMKIGFPVEWPATGDYPLRADGLLANVLAARGYETAREWRRARAERRRDTWETLVRPNAAEGMAAARLTIPNGFPDALTNSILFTAAFLRAPLYDARAPIEVRFGGFGAIAGHELMHALDNHEFDEHGELHDPWTAADAHAHEARRACVVGQANQYAIGDVHQDGDQTLPENDADLGGVAHAYAALTRALRPAQLAAVGADGFTAAQRFFIAYAQHWCSAERPAQAARRLREDNHGPPRFRANGPLANLPAFAQAFACPAGAAMVRGPADRCAVW